MQQTERIFNNREENKTNHIPTKKFNIGDIVYWVENNHRDKPYVNFGIVEDVYGTLYYLAMVGLNIKKTVQRLDTKTGKFIDVCDLKDFHADQCWYKLPKGWSYNTKLYNIVEELRNKEEYKWIDVKNPMDIKEGLDKGILCKKDHFQPHVEVAIESGMFRLIYKSETDHLFAKSKDICNLYETYEECQKICNEIEAENIRIANLSDYDFNLEALNHKLDFIFKDDEITKDKYRKYILSKDNFEDIEFRSYYGDLQWRYWKNKKWLNIDLD